MSPASSSPVSRALPLLAALAMPTIAGLSQAGAFGPTNGEISDRYPTLLVAAGYAFAIWGLIFLLDVAFAVWQARPRPGDDVALAPLRPVVAAGFALTAAWMIVFSQQWFWLALLVIWCALGCLLVGALGLSRAAATSRPQRLAGVALSLHAGWLALAAFMNTAQVVVAYGLLPTDAMLGWSAVLFALAALLLLAANQALRGDLAFAAAALWGLAAVYAKQSGGALPGASAAASIAVAIAVLLAAQTLWLELRARRTRRR